MDNLHILIIDDDEGIRDDLGTFFLEQGYRIFKAALPSEAFKLLASEVIDIVILDFRLPEMDGIEVLKRIKADYPGIEVIMITGHGDTRTIVQSMRAGAFDFFTKPFRMFEVQNAIERTRKFLTLKCKLETANFNYSVVAKELENRLNHPLIGESKAIRDTMELMSKVAETYDTSVLITGESGTGKELVARGIHYLSRRKKNNFCEVNCSAIPESLFESEFFGHAKGTFTGACRNRTGYFEAANGGTLFLDEIGDIPMQYQPKLLRAIEEKTIKRLGTQKNLPVDVRIISATNRNLEELVEQGRFRLDFLHRTNTFIIHLAPLRERAEDIPLLLEYFTDQFAGKLRKSIARIDPTVVQSLKQYEFAGNVRELKNLVERAVILCNGSELTPGHFSNPSYAPITICRDTGGDENGFNLDLIMERTIVAALKKAANKSDAAKLLGISRQALDRKIEKYNIFWE